MSLARAEAAPTFRSLQIPNYRLWFVGQGLSACGTWMDKFAQGWLVLSLTDNSGVAIGAIAAVQWLPMLLLGAWGGVIADRFDKRRLMSTVSVLQTITASVLAALTLSGVIEVWMVFVLAFLSGCAQAFDNPTRSAFVSELVGTEHLLNAISLNSALVHGTRVVGPAIAGVVILTAGTGWCFVINALSFVALLITLSRMDPSAIDRAAPVARAKRQVREGFRYIWSTPLLRAMLLFFVVVGTLAVNFQIVLPLVAKVTFHGNAGTYSVISGAMGVGSVVGTLALARRGRSSVRIVFGAAMIFGTSVCAAALAPSLPVFLVLIALGGVGFASLIAAGNSFVQLTAEPRMRGRVMSVWMICIVGSTPIGGPLVGWISNVASPRAALAVGGGGTLVAGVVILGALLLTQSRGQGRPLLIRATRAPSAAATAAIRPGSDAEAQAAPA